jgi:hypothetical protein
MPLPDDKNVKPAALRQRRSRAKRKAGMESYALYLPTRKIAAAIRVRGKLPQDAVVTRAQLKRTVADAIDWWAERWIRIGHM